jgi:hydrogenase expression/formation protein HypE
MSGRTCPLPIQDFPRVVLGHGGGGKLSAELVEHLFLPAFGMDEPGALGDAAILQVGKEKLCFSTDSFVVTPLFFPGGNIGELAVNGTVNDLAMMGGRPLYLSCGFILEEGFSIEELSLIAQAMGKAGREAGVRLVTGDTKVVEKGHGHGVFINTSGIGLIATGREVGPGRARPGDAVIVSGPIGNHGMAVMSVREGLEFETTIESDTAALCPLVELLMETPEEIRALRDPTRGGVASALNELAVSSAVSIVLEESLIPVDDSVRAACELLGLDPLYVANEGKLVAIVDSTKAELLVERLRSHPLGKGACVIGRVAAEHPGLVALRTTLGATRVVDTLVGEQLPRIC